jgi:hypothetical protein
MGTPLDDLPVLEYENHIGPADGREAMGIDTGPRSSNYGVLPGRAFPKRRRGLWLVRP